MTRAVCIAKLLVWVGVVLGALVAGCCICGWTMAWSFAKLLPVYYTGLVALVLIMAGGLVLALTPDGKDNDMYHGL